MRILRYSILVVMILFLAILSMACENDSKETIPAIAFDSNGGAPVESFYGEVLSDFPYTEKEGYFLEGWYTTKDFSSSQIIFPYEVMEDAKLFARWFTLEEGSPYLVYELDSEKDEYTVTAYTGKSKIVVIPENYQGKPVSAIADGAFNICDTINKIIICSSVENIGRAFYRASMLSEFEVIESPYFVVEDGVLYDYDKTNLISYPPAKQGSSFTVPESVEALANSAFRFSRYLTEVTISKNISDMGQRYFDSCYNLENIFVDNENQEYSSVDGVLYNKNETILYRYPHNYREREYEISEGTYQVAPYAFDESFVESITIPQSVEYFSAVEYCAALEAFSVSSQNQYFASVGGVLFDKDVQTLIQYPQARMGEVYNYENDDKNYYYYELPNTVKTINSWAFDSCNKLNKVVMPESLELISDIAFNNIQGSFKLKEVVFEGVSNLKEIGASAFMECVDLEIFVINAIEPPKLGKNVFNAVSDNFTIYVPDNTYELYQDSDWRHVTKNLERGESLANGKVKFFTNGGQSISDIDTVYLGTEIIPQRQGYVFGGWYSSSDLSGERVNFPLAIRNEKNLYAKWYTHLSGTEGLTFSLQSQTDTYAVIGYSGSSATVTVPTTHNGKLVSAIGVSAFEEKTHITEITLPETITEIKNYAFSGNYNSIMRLEKVNFSGNMLEHIGNYAFNYCQKLSNITLPASVKTIGTRAFNNCISLKSISIPQNVEVIENYVFSSCQQLASFSVNPFNPYFRSDEGALYNKDQTTLIQYPLAKENLSFEMPGSVVTIKSGAFRGATNLKEITLSQNLEVIETTAFHFSGIEEIIIPENMTTVNPSVFRNTPLKNITLGKSLEQIEDLFHELSSLENIFVDELNQYYKSIDGVLFSYDQKTLLRFPTAKTGEFIIPATVETIAPMAFSSSNVEALVLNEGLKDIGENAFLENNSILQVTLPESLEAIGDAAFMNCKNLKAVFLISLTDFPSLGINSFAGTDSNFSVYATNEIKDDMQNDNLWNSHNISSGDLVVDGFHIVLTAQGYKLISVLKEDKDLIVPAQIGEIDIVEVGSFAFNSRVRRIQLPSTIRTIQTYAFASNLDSQLSTIIFEEGSLIETIGQNAFFECLSLTNIVINSALPEVIGASTITELAGRVKLITQDTELYENTVFEELSIIDMADVYGDFIISESGGEAVVKGYLGAQTEIIVPNEINFYPVVGIAKNLINPSTIRVIVPSSVKEIQDYAFSANIYNTGVNEIIMATRDIVFDNGVETIGKRAFEGLDIKYVNIPASVTEIDIEAFDGCLSIETFTVDELNSVYSSVGGVLFNKEKTRLIKYPVGNPRLEYALENGVEVIGEGAFAFASNLISISFNDELDTISSLAFENCYSLLDLQLPDSLLKIEAFAFKNCYRIERLFIPALVEDISYGAIIDCTQMKAVYVDYCNDNYKSDEGVLFDKSQETLISYPAEKSGQYSIPSSVKYISPYAFFNSNLKSVNIPNGVLQIGEYAFANSKVETITIGLGVTQLPRGMLKNCKNLETINLGSGVAHIGDEFALGANNLRNIEFNENIQTIGEKAFYGSSRLNTVHLPDELQSIGDQAFAYCYGMTRFIMPKVLDNLGEGVLKGNSALREITMTTQYALNTIFGEVIAEFIPSSLKDINLHLGVGIIPSEFFKGYHNIENVYLPSTLQMIAKEAFMDCISLERVEISSGYEMSSIGEKAFYNCYLLSVFEIIKSSPPALHPTTFSSQTGELQNLRIYTLSSYYDTYSSAEVWQELEIVDI